MEAPSPRKPRIHFVSLVSVEHDIDLLPYFFPHYDGIHADNYCIFLHEGPDTDANLWAEGAAKSAGWKSRFVPRGASYGNGELKRALLEKFRRSCPGTDYIICADGDEFQSWETALPQEAVEKGVDMVLGKRIDRFHEKLLPINHDLELEENFPLEHENLSKVLFPKRPRARDKIVMARAQVPVDYKHCTNLSVRDPGRLSVADGVPILHYKWRRGILNRLAERPDYTPQELQAIKHFFEMEK